MTGATKPPKSTPIPALYTVYILRSTVRHASLYIGSTPNPPRRLAQHNGLVKGGAVRTSRKTLRPWEMVGLVSGFPSMVAALKFEWALTNPHLSMHIPSTERLVVSTQRKRNGHPKRPPASMTSILSNLHLLLRVPSFARWPLRLHFFVPEVFRAWGRCCGKAEKGVGAGSEAEARVVGKLRAGFTVVTDFEKEHRQQSLGTAAAGEEDEEDIEGGGGEGGGGAKPPAWGIHALPLDYEPIKDYVAKGQSIFEFERQGDCVVCRETIDPEKEGGLHAICTNDGCEAVGHLLCWKRHFMPRTTSEGDDDDILPIQGRCPKCQGEIQWVDMMKELTLRLRGKTEVQKLLKTKRRRVVKPKVAATAA